MSKITKTQIKLSVLIFIFLFNTIAIANTSKIVSTARKEIWKAINNGQATSVSAAVIDNGNFIYDESIGMINWAKAIPAVKDTQYNIGSISKIFTAAAVLQLCEQNKLNLDTPVYKYLPKFKMNDPKYKKITIRMLLNHSSGMPGSNYYNIFTTFRDRNYIDSTLSLLCRSKLKSDPGTISIYCNDGFTVAEALIEHISGKSYTDYLEENIFTKADMNNTSCYFKKGNSNIARYYDPETGYKLPIEYANALGSGGIASTSKDLCLFANALLNGNILTEKYLKEYTEFQYAPITVPNGSKPLFACGLGWDEVSISTFVPDKIKVWGKNGGLITFKSQLLVAPKQNIAVAVIIAGSGDAGSIASKIMNSVFVEKNIIKKKDTTPVLPPKSVQLTNNLYAFEGYYCGTFDGSNNIGKISFNKDKNEMMITKFSNGQFLKKKNYKYLGNNSFYFDKTHSLHLLQMKEKQYIIFYLNTTKQSLVLAEKIKPGKSSIDTSAYKNKTWLPLNYNYYDFATALCGYVKTGSLKELPGLVYINKSDNCILYKPDNEMNLEMILQYLRDQNVGGIKNEGGNEILQLNNFKYINSEKISFLKPNEQIVIQNNGFNVSKKIKKEMVFNSNIPVKSRILVFSKDNDIVYDSMTNPKKALILPAESYITFIGSPGTKFNTENK